MNKNVEKVIRESTNRTKIMACSRNCKHPYQDKLYGGRRVHNAIGSPQVNGWRCTVCSSETMGK